MRRNRIVVGVAVAVGLLALIVAGLLQPSINRSRSELEILPPPVIDSDAPSGVLVAQAGLGPMRGLMIDYLWLRALDHQQQGQYYDFMQISDWILTLQPRLPEVWRLQSSVMAFDVPATLRESEERWEWVTRGIEILREKGIPRNPHSGMMYDQLGKTFNAKVAGDADDHIERFKLFFAREWHGILGEPPDETEARMEYMRRIALAPRTQDALLRNPAARHAWEELQEMGYAPGGTLRQVKGLLERIGRLEGVFHSPDAAVMQDPHERLHEQGGELAEKLHHWLHGGSEHQDRVGRDQTEYAGHGEGPQLVLAHLRARVLRSKNMDPGLMLQAMEKHGPLDWRHGSSHTVYWSLAGLQQVPDGNDAFMIRNNMILALRELMRTGYVHHASDSWIPLMPDPRFVDPAYEELARQLELDDAPTKSQHESVLREAMEFSWFYGKPQQARRYHRKLVDLLGEDHPDTRLSIEKLVLTQFMRRMKIRRYADLRRTIEGLLGRGINQGLTFGRQEVANSYFQQARLAHEWYSRQQVARPSEEIIGRLEMPPFDEMLRNNLERQLMQSPNLLLSARIWRNTPPALQELVWDRIRDELHRRAEAAGLDPKRAFPAPGQGPFQGGHDDHDDHGDHGH